MKVTEVTYEMRKVIGKYEHENLTCTITLDENDSGDEAMKEARRVCVQGSTAYLEAIKARDKKQEITEDTPTWMK